MVSEYGSPKPLLKISTVLILVLVEDGLGVFKKCQHVNTSWYSLNPCFSGGWSRRMKLEYILVPEKFVLILVLVEDGLGEQLLELTVSETVVAKFLISLTFGDQKYVPFRVLSRMQIYGFFCELGVRASKNFGFFDGVFGYFVGWRWSWG